jgi:hypothetical protein
MKTKKYILAYKKYSIYNNPKISLTIDNITPPTNPNEVTLFVNGSNELMGLFANDNTVKLVKGTEIF